MSCSVTCFHLWFTCPCCLCLFCDAYQLVSSVDNWKVRRGNILKRKSIDFHPFEFAGNEAGRPSLVASIGKAGAGDSSVRQFHTHSASAFSSKIFWHSKSSSSLSDDGISSDKSNSSSKHKKQKIILLNNYLKLSKHK